MHTFKTTTYYDIMASDLEKIINLEYNVKDFSIVADEEGSNYSSKTYDLAKEEMHEYDKDRLKDFIATKGRVQYMTGILLQDLVNRDIIPEGDYLVDLSW